MAKLTTTLKKVPTPVWLGGGAVAVGAMFIAARNRQAAAAETDTATDATDATVSHVDSGQSGYYDWHGPPVPVGLVRPAAPVDISPSIIASHGENLLAAMVQAVRGTAGVPAFPASPPPPPASAAQKRKADLTGKIWTIKGLIAQIDASLPNLTENRKAKAEQYRAYLVGQLQTAEAELASLN